MKNDSWTKEFDILWGEAPTHSLKGKKGVDIKQFIFKEIQKVREDEHERILAALPTKLIWEPNEPREGAKTACDYIFNETMKKIRALIQSPTTIKDV